MSSFRFGKPQRRGQKDEPIPKFVRVFQNFKPHTFKSFHDEDFMMVRDTELSTLYEQY